MSATEETLLPRGWKKVRVKDVADAIQYGYTASAINRKNGPRLLRITDIQNGHVDWAAVPSCDIPEEDIPKYRLSPGDLVFARTGATTGKSFLIGDCPEAVFASYLIRVRASVDVSPRYLSAYFQSPDYWRQIERGKRGIGQPNVNGKVLGEVEFPLAPLNEQHDIVAEIEKQFTRLEAGVAGLRHVQANLKRYRAAVLKAACEGKLVTTEAELARQRKKVAAASRRCGSEENQSRDGSATQEGPGYETGAQLLERILTERRQKWKGKGKYKEPVKPNTANFPELPDGWTWASLDELLRNVTDGDHQPPPQTDSGVPFLVIGNIRNHEIDFTDTRFVSRAYYDAIDSFRKPKRGDILYSLVGSYGIAVSVKTDQEFCVQRHIGILRPHDLSPTDYLVHALNSSFVFNQATAVATGTAQKTVSLAWLRKFAIPLSPMQEQTSIVTELERRLSVVEELEAVVNANLQRSSRLRQSILQRAFEGTLLRTEKEEPSINDESLPLAAEPPGHYGQHR